MFKMLKGNAPSYLKSLFSVRTLEYDVRNNRSIKLHTPKPRTNYLKRSICYSGALLWNNLPQEIRNLPNLSQFKRATNDYVDIENIDSLPAILYISLLFYIIMFVTLKILPQINKLCLSIYLL